MPCQRGQTLAFIIRLISRFQKPAIDSIPDLSLSVAREKDYLNEEGRILLRYSGTEPKLRLLVEGQSLEKISASYQRISLAIEKSL